MALPTLPEGPWAPMRPGFLVAPGPERKDILPSSMTESFFPHLPGAHVDRAHGEPGVLFISTIILRIDGWVWAEGL